ncbi:hypothetical protein EV126DRAFT_233046 [Verticillium dahliae]|nr:hypothetical protein EV126DRAFT_233046 [Verticillium dahliae]
MSRCFGSDDSPRNGPAWTNKNTPSYRIEPAVPLYSSISANEAPERNRGRRSSHALGPRHCRWATERCGRRVPPHALRYAGTRLSSLQSSANWRGLCHRGDRVCPMSTSGNVPSLGLPRLIKGRDPRFWGLEGLVFRRIFGRWPLRQPHREVSVWHPRANSPPPRGHAGWLLIPRGIWPLWQSLRSNGQDPVVSFSSLLSSLLLRRASPPYKC